MCVSATNGLGVATERCVARLCDSFAARQETLKHVCAKVRRGPDRRDDVKAAGDRVGWVCERGRARDAVNKWHLELTINRQQLARF